MNRLQRYIPEELQRKIIEVAAEKKYEPVYRVDKEGILSDNFLKSSYEEFPDRFPSNEVGTYSTSVYDVPAPCIRYIKSLKGKLRKKYPSPKIMVGSTVLGMTARTIEYKKDYEDKNHIDWWIYQGEEKNAIRYFEEYKDDEAGLD